MLDFSTLILLPFILAFLIFALRFYGRESASSMRNLSFIMAFLTMASAGAYLYLRVTGGLPPYSTAGFGLLGLALLGTAIARMFMI
jgi:ABC-type uncharacterized transport system permease subunit